jgi:phospholipase C
MADKLDQINHVVVLMLENRAFDHLLGYLKAQGIKPSVEGLTGTEAIPADPGTSGSPLVVVSPTAGDTEPDPDAGHEIQDVREQFYGQVGSTFPPGGPSNGFVVNYAKQSPTPANAADIMKCVDPGAIPALRELAKHFCVCNRWYASLPGPTWPNRLFAHAATSAGTVTNDLKLYYLPTIFDRLDTAGFDWRIYYHDIPQAIIFRSFFEYLWWLIFIGRFRTFDQWASDLAAPTCGLPTYTFIEPQYFSFDTDYANDQHPSHPIARADRLIRDVYESLRASPCWAHSMLVIVHDEHGGTYDHRFPDASATNPDGNVSTTPFPFDFTSYGVRVPAVIVSPWAGNGVCNDLYDHTSIPATLEKRFGLVPLTARDAAANALGGCLNATQPRLSPEEAPLTLPVAGMQMTAAQARSMDPHRRTVSAYQHALVELAARLRIPGETAEVSPPRSDKEQDAAQFVRERMQLLRTAAARQGRAAGSARRGGKRRGRPRGR